MQVDSAVQVQLLSTETSKTKEVQKSLEEEKAGRAADKWVYRKRLLITAGVAIVIILLQRE
jgi:hypothetical protein